MQDSVVIKVDHLHKQYKTHKKEPGLGGALKSLFARKYETIKAVEDVSFLIREGELVGFIGPNGAGKTTTLKCLSGLLYPTKGEIYVLGFSPWQRNHEFLKKIALVMGQKNQLWWDLPSLDTFLLNKEIYEIPNQRFNEVLLELSTLLKVKDDNALWMYRDLTQMGRIPVDVYKEPLRGVLTFVIPVGVMMTFPPKAIMGLLSFWAIGVAFVISGLFIFSSLLLWKYALTKYASASS